MSDELTQDQGTNDQQADGAQHEGTDQEGLDGVLSDDQDAGGGAGDDGGDDAGGEEPKTDAPIDAPSEKPAGFVGEVDELGVPRPSTTPTHELGLADARAELEWISQGRQVLVDARNAYEAAALSKEERITDIEREFAAMGERVHQINARLHRDVNKRVEDLAAHVATLQARPVAAAVDEGEKPVKKTKKSKAQSTHARQKAQSTEHK